MEIGFIDHYDSFSFNLVDWLKTASNSSGTNKSVSIRHVYCDDLPELNRLYLNGIPLVFSPGPNQPQNLPQSMDLLSKSLGRVPIFGVCLGFQMLGVHAGLPLRSAKQVFHGSHRAIQLELDHSLGSGALTRNEHFEGPIVAGVYNSLGFHVEDSGLLIDPAWQVIAKDDFGNIQGLLWRSPAVQPGRFALGVQFHPESFLSSGVEGFRDIFFNEIATYYRSLDHGNCALVDPFVANNPHGCA